MIGRITYWNNPKGFGFITVVNTDDNGTFQKQYFFHHSNFRSGETPVLGGIVVFNLGEPVAIGKKIQAVGVRYATAAEIEQTNYARRLMAGVNAIASGTGAR
jgi:cold shock CspA family protein